MKRQQGLLVWVSRIAARAESERFERLDCLERLAGSLDRRAGTQNGQNGRLLDRWAAGQCSDGSEAVACLAMTQNEAKGLTQAVGKSHRGSSTA